MPISLVQIASNTATVTLSGGVLGDETVTVTYFPGRFTEKAVTVLNSFASMTQTTMEEGFAAFNETLAGLIKSWDVFEDDAKTRMFPVEAARFGELPLQFRIQVLTGIASDIRPESVAA